MCEVFLITGKGGLYLRPEGRRYSPPFLGKTALKAIRRCVIIPAVKKNAVIPDQLVKRLAGKILIQRALDVAKACVAAEDVFVVTDSEEISLICERNGVRFFKDRNLRFRSHDLVAEMQPLLQKLAADYDVLIIYRASCPLLGHADIDDACTMLARSHADALVSVRSVRCRIWEVKSGGIDSLDEDAESELVVESKALILLTSDAAHSGKASHIVPYFLNDRAVEINSYQDWWICERLLQRKNVLFVVAGYPAIGMGHIYRSLMLAHEIANHRVSFLCTSQSELAAKNIAAKDYRTHIQDANQNLADAVLAQKPDLVINDMLDTDAGYMQRLKAVGLHVVNFEDEGSGADFADMVFNALYERASSSEQQPPHFFYGHRFFCLRDEFLEAERNVFRPDFGHGKGCLLVTFGGTDAPDFTRQTLDIVEPVCRAHGIAIRVVTGPGYAHREELAAHIRHLDNPQIRFEYATNIMSRMMEGADLAICSAGRTVYELAHMRIPGIVLAQHAREARHTFARAKNGFVYQGIMHDFKAARLKKAFLRILDDPAYRETLYNRQNKIDFRANKSMVVQKILELIGS